MYSIEEYDRLSAINISRDIEEQEGYVSLTLSLIVITFVAWVVAALCSLRFSSAGATVLMAIITFTLIVLIAYYAIARSGLECKKQRFQLRNES